MSAHLIAISRIPSSPLSPIMASKEFVTDQGQKLSWNPLIAVGLKVVGTVIYKRGSCTMICA